MSRIGVLLLVSGLGAAGLLLVVSGMLQPAPSLARTIKHLRRTGSDPTSVSAGATSIEPRPLLGGLVELLRTRPGLLPSDAQLRLAGRSVEQHVTYMALAVVAGLVAPVAIVAILQWTGLIGVHVVVPLLAALAGAVVAVLIVHASTVERANAVRADLRYQVSAYLDVVTMLLAGNAGYEGALEQASWAGDGRLFAELRRRMRQSGTRGASLTEALARTGRELGVSELEEVAATAALSAAEGAPVARTLAAKCATLRSALATEQETEARLRTSRLTTPIVGMALIFMALVIYPALSFA